jgi:hypothetical protein
MKDGTNFAFSFISAAQTFPVMQELSFLPEWVALWAPPLAHALVSGSASGRKQVAALCIPLLVTIVGGATNRSDAATAFALLLDEVQMHQNRGCSAGENIQPYAWKTETIFDQILWAKLEVAIASVAHFIFILSARRSYFRILLMADFAIQRLQRRHGCKR